MRPPTKISLAPLHVSLHTLADTRTLQFRFTVTSQLTDHYSHSDFNKTNQQQTKPKIGSSAATVMRDFSVARPISGGLITARRVDARGGRTGEPIWSAQTANQYLAIWR